MKTFPRELQKELWCKQQECRTERRQIHRWGVGVGVGVRGLCGKESFVVLRRASLRKLIAVDSTTTKATLVTKGNGTMSSILNHSLCVRLVYCILALVRILLESNCIRLLTIELWRLLLSNDYHLKQLVKNPPFPTTFRDKKIVIFVALLIYGRCFGPP